jgi:hypothetical protein
MRTRLQSETSRVNGAKSQGPVTPEGKARSAGNSTTHGLYSNAILLAAESKAEWQQLVDGLIERFQPADGVELGIVTEMAIASWRARRAVAMEAALIEADYEMARIVEPPVTTPEAEYRLYAIGYANAVGRMKAVIELGRQSERLNRLWMRLHAKLKELQADRRASENAAQQIRKNEPGTKQTTSNQEDRKYHPHPVPSPVPAGPVSRPQPPPTEAPLEFTTGSGVVASSI